MDTQQQPLSECKKDNNSSLQAESLQTKEQQKQHLISEAKIIQTDFLLLNTQKNLMTCNKKKYALVKFFINKVLDPNSVFCLTEFVNVPKDTIVNNVERNKELLRTYSESYSNLLGFKSIITKNTPNEEIKNDYIIKFIKQCLTAIGYVFVGRITDKRSKPRKINYSIKLSTNLLVRM